MKKSNKMRKYLQLRSPSYLKKRENISEKYHTKTKIIKKPNLITSHKMDRVSKKIKIKKEKLNNFKRMEI